MNPTDESTQQIPELIEQSKNIAIVLPATPNPDAIASATGLYLALSSIGKSASIICSSSPQSDLMGADKITSSFSSGGDNLIISFPYEEGAIDKVDYSIQGSSFNLIITPRAGFPKLDTNKVNFNYSGGTVDLIITVDVPNLNSIGAVYEENKTEFESKSIINVDRHLVNDLYGVANLVNKTSSSTSELVLELLETIQAPLNKDIATNLYAGIVIATNGFTSYSVNARTFEASATLLRAGAIKKALQKPAVTSQQNRPQQQQQQKSQPSQSSRPQQPPRVQPQQNTMKQFQTKEVVRNQTIEEAEIDPSMDEGPQTPQEWLKPKIFRGGGGLI